MNGKDDTYNETDQPLIENNVKLLIFLSVLNKIID